MPKKIEEMNFQELEEYWNQIETNKQAYFITIWDGENDLWKEKCIRTATVSWGDFNKWDTFIRKSDKWKEFNLFILEVISKEKKDKTYFWSIKYAICE